MASNTVEPPVNQKVKPASMVPVASVVMNDSTPKRPTSQPLNMPKASAASSVSTTASGSGRPATASCAASTPPKLAMAPTDRSNSPAAITKVAPTAISTRKAICRLTLTALPSVANAFGLSTANTMQISPSATTVA